MGVMFGQSHFFVYLCKRITPTNDTTKMKKGLALLLLVVCLCCSAQTRYDTLQYSEENGLPSNHVTQILQDEQGFVWFSTWNGLCRFDGYEFQTFKAVPGDSCQTATDRLRSIWLTDEGDIYCRVEENDILRFDLRTYRFCDITSKEERERAIAAERHATKRGRFNGTFFEFDDRQGLHWELRNHAVYCMRPIHEPAHPVAMHQSAQIRCLARDREGCIWMTTREDATVRLLDGQLQPIGYLRPDGRIQAGYVSFGQPVYCITQTRDGTIWLGSKPGGLFRYDRHASNLQHIDNLPHQAIYDIKEDRQGRLWLATLGGGLLCMDGGKVHQFLPTLKTRYIHLTNDDVLLATTTEGLVVGALDKNTKDITFRQHRREANRTTSLNCNATMDILQDDEGRLFVSTESGGVSVITSKDLTGDTLSFRPLTMRGGWPTEVALSMAATGKNHEMLITSSNQLIVYNPDNNTGTTYDNWFFHHPYYFSEVRPLRIDNGRWLIGSMEGAFTLDTKDMRREPFIPHIAFTAITFQSGATRYNVNHLDTLRLTPNERSLTILFAALDFSNAQRIRYEFRFGDETTPWNAVGRNHSVTLLDLKPGTYELWIRSTNADGMSVDNLRRLVIIAQPTFWESVWGQLLMILLTVGLLATITYTILYIRRIKHKQHETLEAYLTLMEKQDETKAVRHENKAIVADDPTIQRVMQFIEQNISNSDASVGDMAEAAATSRSGLQRKLKQTMGITPQDLLREARIKHACLLLQTTDKTVAEIAYACGFTDPKYFSRCFKQSTGQVPTEYKNASNR